MVYLKDFLDRCRYVVKEVVYLDFCPGGTIYENRELVGYRPLGFPENEGKKIILFSELLSMINCLESEVIGQGVNIEKTMTEPEKAYSYKPLLRFVYGDNSFSPEELVSFLQKAKERLERYYV